MEEDKREFLTYLSLSAAISAMMPAESLAQPKTAASSAKLSIPNVKDIASIDNRLSSVPIETRRKFIDFLAKSGGGSAASGGTCGCNAVCKCNDNTSSCCELKCACDTKSSNAFTRPDLILKAPDFKVLVKGFNPDELETFNDLSAVLNKIPALALASTTKPSQPLGVNDHARGFKPGSLTRNELEGFHTIRDINGQIVKKEFIDKQFK